MDHKSYLNLLRQWIIYLYKNRKKPQVKNERKEMMQASMRAVFKSLGAVHTMPREWWGTKAWIPWMISPMRKIGQRPLIVWWRTKAWIPWMIPPMSEIGKKTFDGISGEPRQGYLG